jgi:hypothetical protein
MQVQSSHQTCDHERIEELSGECGLSGHILYVSLIFIHEHDDERPEYETYSCRYEYYHVLLITVVPTALPQIFIQWRIYGKPWISHGNLFTIENQIFELHGEIYHDIMPRGKFYVLQLQIVFKTLKVYKTIVFMQ